MLKLGVRFVPTLDVALFACLALNLGARFFDLQGDPTYLVVTQDSTIEKFGINAVCTHLGCVVPWVAVSARFGAWPR